jgi:hypothetical protein
MALRQDSTTTLPASLGGGHPAPHADLVAGEGELEAFDAHRAAEAVRLAFGDEAADRLLEEQVG